MEVAASAVFSTRWGAGSSTTFSKVRSEPLSCGIPAEAAPTQALFRSCRRDGASQSAPPALLEDARQGGTASTVSLTN